MYECNNQCIRLKTILLKMENLSQIGKINQVDFITMQNMLNLLLCVTQTELIEYQQKLANVFFFYNFHFFFASWLRWNAFFRVSSKIKMRPSYCCYNDCLSHYSSKTKYFISSLILFTHLQGANFKTSNEVLFIKWKIVYGFFILTRNFILDQKHFRFMFLGQNIRNFRFYI